MFAKANYQVSFSQRVVATLVAGAMLMGSLGIYHKAQAASLAYISNTLSTSEPGVTSAHTISFTLASSSTGFGDTDTVTIQFESFTGVNTVVSGDVTVTVDGTPDAVGTFTPAAGQISFDGVTAAADQEVVVAIADGKIVNPAQGSYDITIDTGTGGDSGKTMVATTEVVTVSASVDTNFIFTVTGLATTTAVNTVNTTGSSSPTVLNYAQLDSGVPEALAQRLNVTTNAKNGFVVTVETDGAFESANGADIDMFDDGVEVTAPGTAWNSPTPDVLNEDTWGHWGLTTNDSNLGTGDGYYAGTDFGANEFIAASTSPRAVFAHTGVSDGTTQDIGQADVLYQVEITGLQEAADDYQTTLTYIATPTF